MTSRFGRATPLIVYAVLAVGIGLSAWAYVGAFQRRLTARVERELSTIAELKVGQLVDWRENQKHEWSELALDRIVADALRRAVRGDGAVRRDLAQSLRLKREHLDAAAAFVIDPRGVVVAADPADARPSLRELEVAQQALRTSEQLLDEGAPGDALVVAVSSEGRLEDRGVVLARYDPARAISAMVLRWPHP